MLYLTKQERLLLLLIAFIFFSGSVLHFIFKKFPQLENSIQFLDSHAMQATLEINAASEEQFMGLPYIGEKTARAIVAYRKEHGGFNSVDEIKNVKGIRQKNFDRFKAHLKCAKRK